MRVEGPNPRGTSPTNELRRPSVSLGIFAYDEELLIGHCLSAFLDQRPSNVTIDQVIVISSGSSDRTVPRARAASRDSRLTVIDRPERAGKIVAINEFLRVAKGDIIVVAAGDTIPADDLIERLCSPLVSDASCGMTGPRVRQRRQSQRPLALVNEVLWDMHHWAALRSPKLGEVVAIRRSIVPELPMVAHCDEVVMEALATELGYRIEYVDEAVVWNYGVESVRALFGQRRRIYCQHLWASRNLDYSASTLRLRNLLVRVVLRQALSVPRSIPAIALLGVIELAARVRGAIDFRRGTPYQTWDET